MGWLKDFTRSPFDYGASARRARHRRYEDREYQQLMANRPDALGMNYAEMTPEQRKAVRNFYMKPGQNAWNERATIDFYQLNNRINPETGMLEGDFSLVPAHLARQYQMEADMAVERRRQRMMQGGIDYMQGATSLLQSYRPGGSAALEAGIHGQTAGLMFERARMTQPLDYMSDLRRHEQAMVERRNRRAADRAMYTQIGTSLATLVAGAFTGGAGAAAVGALSGGIQAATRDNGRSGYAYSGGQMGAYNNYDAQASTLNTMGQVGQGTGTGGQTPMTQGPSLPNIAPMSVPADPSGGGIMGSESARAATQLPSDPSGGLMGPGAGSIMGSEGGGVSGGGGGAGVDMGGAMAAPSLLGASGNFTPQGLMMESAAMGPDADIATMGERLGVMQYAADTYESDPFFASFDGALNELYMSLLQPNAGVAE